MKVSVRSLTRKVIWNLFFLMTIEGMYINETSRWKWFSRFDLRILINSQYNPDMNFDCKIFIPELIPSSQEVLMELLASFNLINCNCWMTSLRFIWIRETNFFAHIYQILHAIVQILEYESITYCSFSNHSSTSPKNLINRGYRKPSGIWYFH